MEKIPVAGEIYRHFKGDMYRVVTTAKHADTEETFAVYQKLCGDYGIFVLPLSEFAGKTEDGKERFVLIPAPEIVRGETDRAGRPENGSPFGEQGSDNEERSELRSVKADTDGSEEESGLDAGLLAFLEAETYAEKLRSIPPWQAGLTSICSIRLRCRWTWSCPEAVWRSSMTI